MRIRKDRDIFDINTREWKKLPEIKNKNGSLKHIVKEGSREHVLYWDTFGTHCSEPECEINYKSKLSEVI